ncbi:hypothetical protein RJZ56_002541 [Blastomyces dermatitidis]|uniref:Zn(2)-C6 fungal-type domain-containing protein n=1 Tax=Ajellomyces dermatitidis (strain ATCC 18188 / CBS 674.68) TaxID=653446 RepID=F2T828_AJEDA|nr:hypothetical protein BDDG_02330 [Blastomyces dermatitidis ATCC 18188]
MATSSCPQPLKARQMDASDAFPTPAPRKRRRKAVSNGAADDCFTCANRSVKCDRRRPYCTQCLGLGMRCSGYKTTLTWGVGVASRGKLRGLSWPVCGALQAAASATVADSTRQAAESERRLPPPASRARPDVKVTARSASKRTRPDQLAARKTTTVATIDSLQHVDVTVSSSPPGPSNLATHRSSAPTESSVTPTQLPQTEDKYPLLVNSAAPLLSSRHHDSTAIPFRSPGVESGHPGPIPFVSYIDAATTQPIHPSASQPAISNADFNYVSSGLAPQLQEFSPRIGGSHSHLAISQFESLPPWPQKTLYDANSQGSEARPDVNFRNKSPKRRSTPPDYFLLSAYHQESNIRSHTSFVPQPVSMQFIGRTPRMQYLINYYAEVISPVIVAFDSPANPYRMFILELAKTSDTLQHALAALSLSNLRQRKDHWGLSARKTLPARLSSTAHYRMAGQSCEERFGNLGLEEQQKEESFHKAMAITSLNAQLAHPTQRLADSVLATVLVLCLFHMCDTGVAKFRPQLAGVKKLLALRRSANRNCSDLVKWYTRMFVWFDVLTATINNRDCELKGDYLDIAASGHDDWALANLAGCDGSMFKIIGQLSRLNMLSQGKASAEPPSMNEWPIATAPPPPNMLHHSSMPPPFNESYDTTHTPLQLHMEDTILTAVTTKTPSSDSRPEFWREWHALRHRLEAWTLQLPEGPRAATDSSTLAGSFPHPHISPTNLSDLSNISESFRYSALLYLERLAHPNLPSAHPRIQRLVYISLHHMSAVKSDVYLLWPLFVTGAECTLDPHRALIRRNCSDIQKDSGFFNNLASLELLEKIWAADASGSLKPAKQQPMASAALKRSRSPNDAGSRFGDGEEVLEGGEAFKWRRIMDLEGSDGEYIVV